MKRAAPKSIEVLKFLMANPGSSYTQVAAGTGIQSSTVSSLLSGLVKRGMATENKVKNVAPSGPLAKHKVFGYWVVNDVYTMNPIVLWPLKRSLDSVGEQLPLAEKEEAEAAPQVPSELSTLHMTAPICKWDRVTLFANRWGLGHLSVSKLTDLKADLTEILEEIA